MTEKNHKANDKSQVQGEQYEKQIAIIGVGLRFPKADTLEQLWEHLLAERSLITEIPPDRWDKNLYWGQPGPGANKTSSIWGGFIDYADCFDASFFNVSPREASFMDPQQRIALELAWKAVEDAGYRAAALKNYKTGVFMGVCNSDYTEMIEKYSLKVDPYMATGTANAILSNRISHWFDFKGPSLTIDTACASSLVALHQAVRAIKNKECEYALAGGVNFCWSPRRFVALSQSGMLAGDGKCKTFDEKADGYVRGEGGAILVLKSLDRAVADNDHIYAVIKGTGTNHGGRTSSLTVTNPGAQADLIVEVYEKAGISPDTVGYIEVHGVGSPLGDSMEVYGLKTAFNKLYKKWNKEIKIATCGIGSVKTNIGHLEAAAGMAGILKIIASLSSKIIPASINFNKLNSIIKIEESPFYIASKARPWEAGSDDSGVSLPRRAGVSAIGWGGSNAHVILEEYIPGERAGQCSRYAADEERPVLIPLSARNYDRLKEYALSICQFLKKSECGSISGQPCQKISLAELSYTLQTGREALEERVIFWTKGIQHFIGQLEAFSRGGEDNAQCWRGRVPKGKRSDEDYSDQIQQWIEQNRAEKIAEAWVNGFPIDWGLFYLKGRPPRLSLPTYPFARERHWIPEKDAGPHTISGPAAGPIHPLLQQNTSDFYRQRFSSTFSGDEFFLADHVVKNQRVLPGVAALEMARAAVWQAAGELEEGRSALRLTDVVWVRPISVEEQPVEVHIGLLLEENGEIAFEIYSRQEAAGAKTEVHCQGRAHFTAAAAAADLDLKDILARCTRGNLSSTQCYAAYREAGIDYGPGHRGIEKVYTGVEQALARISLPPSVADTLRQYVLHPGLLDSAWQASLFLMDGPKAGKPVLPFSLQEVVVLKSCSPQMWAFIRYSSGSKTGDRVEKVDIDLCDDRGAICVRMRGLSFRELMADGSRPPLVAAAAAAPDMAGIADGSLPEKVQSALLRAVAGLLQVRLEDIDGHTELSEYGFGSITFTELANYLNRQYRLSINPTIFFEYPTLDGLANYLVKEHREVLARQLAIQEPAVAVEQYAADRSTGRLPVRRQLQPLAGPEVFPAAGLSGSTPEPVAIVGMSGIFPGAGDVHEFWKNLLEGKDCITEIPKERWDWREYYGDPATEANKTNIKWGGFIDGVDEFDPLFFGISPKEAELMDPQQRLMMTCIWKAIEDAGYSAERLSGTKTAIFVATWDSGYSRLISLSNAAIEGYSFTGMLPSVGPNRMSYFLNIHGPSEPIETACSSSLVAINRAVSAIESGSCEMAIVGGVNTIMTPDLYISFSKAGILCEDGRCKTFSNQANGYVRGEGAGILFLKRLKDAERDGDHIYGVIRGIAENHGGRSNSLTAPNPKAQAELLQAAYTKAGVDPGTVTYIEAHGTGTKLGDPIEINGLKAAFKKLYQSAGDARVTGAHCGLGSVKTNIGHLELAAGIAGVIKVLLQLKHKTLVKSLHCDTINPYIRLEDSPFYVVRENADWKSLRDKEGKELPRRAGVSSFGFGGSNAHVVIEEYIEGRRERPHPAITSGSPAIILLSAKNEDRLMDQVQQLLAAIQEQQFTGLSLADMAYTLQVGRVAMEERLAVMAVSIKELEDKLKSYLEGRDGIEYLYRGQVKGNKETLAIFEADEDLQEAIDKWMRRGKYAKLLELWVKGLPVDWNLLYGEAKPRRISLPTYPFARERYWVPKNGAIASVRDVEAAPDTIPPIHPLLHQNTSDLFEQRFTSTFTGREFFLADHVVKGQRILPGVAQLEMIRAAVAQAAGAWEDGKAGIRFKNVVWVRPIAICEQPVRVNIVLVPEDSGNIYYEICSDPGEDDAEPILHSQGRAELSSAGEDSALDLKALLAQCGQGAFSAGQFYEAFSSTGIDLGPSFRGIETVYAGSGQVLAKLSMPASIYHTQNQFILHPSFMDSALQATFALRAGLGDTNSSGGNAPLNPYLPFSLQEMEIKGGCTPNMWALVRYSNGSKSGDVVEKYDITVCDEAGKVYVRILGLATRVLEGMTVPEDTSASAGTLMLQPCWQEGGVLPEAAPDLEQHLVMLCEPDSLLKESIEAKMSGVRCITLQSGQKGIEERFQTYAAMVFEEIQRILKEKLKGTVLIQIVVHTRGEGQLFSGLGGLLKTARLENPRLKGQMLEVEPGEHSEEIIQILKESSRSLDDSHIQYQGGKRRAAGWTEIEASREELNLPWKDGGVYLITGGAGGLGLIFAKEIAQKVKDATLILTGRSVLGEDRQTKSKQLEALGARIQYRQVDVTHKEAVAGLIQSIQDQYGNLNGIVHSAGVIRDNLIIKKTRDELLEVLAPKVTGLVNLDQASKDLSLDFFLLFSSITGSLGNQGQADYSTANAFMDAYSGYRNALVASKQRRGKTLSISWPLWREGGMQVNKEIEELVRQNTGMTAMQTPNGIQALYQGLASGKDRLFVMEGNIARMKQKLLMTTPYAVQSGKAQAAARSTGDIDAGSLQDRVQAALIQAFSKLFKVKSGAIDADAELSKYGFDSMTSTQFTNKLNKEYGLQLNPTIFFEHPTLSGFSEYLIKEYRDLLAARFAVQAKANNSGQATEGGEDVCPPAGRRRSRFAKTVEFSSSAGYEPIAIVGMSGRFPMARDVHEFWRNLVEGKDCITEIPEDRWDWREYYGDPKKDTFKTSIKWGGFIDGVGEFDPQFFSISPREAETMDPQQRLLLTYVWKALEDAGIAPGSLSQSATGVFIAAGTSEYRNTVTVPLDNLLFMTSSIIPSVIPNRISYALNLRGPSEYFESACCSTLVALHRAVQSIHSGECDQAIVGAVNLLLTPLVFIGFEAMGYLSADGKPKPFQAEAGGYVRSEGVGAIILKPLQKAIQNKDIIYTVIKGTGISHGGRGMSLTAPNAAGMKAAMVQAYQASRIDPRTVSYIEAHGIASPLGDGIEINALKSGYKELEGVYLSDSKKAAPCYISTLKPCIGHGEVFSGMAELIKVILAIRHQLIPGIPRFTTLNESISLKGSPFQIAAQNQNWEAPKDDDNKSLPRRASINSYSFSGMSGHVVLEEYIAPREETIAVISAAQPQIVVFSAKNQGRLKAVVQQTLDFIELQNDISIPDLAYTLQVGREAMDSRVAMVVSSREELILCLKGYLNSAGEGKEIETSLSIYTGDLENEPSDIRALLAGKLEETVLQVLLEEKNLEKIAHYWAKGGRIPWEWLHTGRGARRISLPAYPFGRKRYWIPQVAKQQPIKPEESRSLVNPADGDPGDGRLGSHIKKGISQLLGIPPGELPTGKPLTSLGFSSLQAVTLRYLLEQFLGVEIPITAVSGHNTIEQLEISLGEIINPECTGQPEESCHSDIKDILPVIIPDIAGRYKPFPLSDIQESFLSGRSLRFGGDWVGCHIYFEMEMSSLDIYRLNRAWDSLIRHHEMLRAVIMADGKQSILEKTSPYNIKTVDLRRKNHLERSGYLEKVRENMSHKVYEPGKWPLFEVRISVCPGNKYVVHFSIDEFVLDAGGAFMLLQQWQRLYEKPDWKLPELNVSFRDYILAVKRFEGSKRYKRDLEYWMEKLEDMPQGPAPLLQHKPVKPDVKDNYYRTRLEGTLEEKQWHCLKEKADQLNVSPTALLLGIFTETLRFWSDRQTFSLILTFFNRLPLHPQLDQVLGPFISTNIFVVDEKKGRNLEELIRYNQERLWDDLGHSSVSGIRVLRELKSRRKISGALYLPVVFTSLVSSPGTESASYKESFLKRISFMVTQTPQVYLDHQVLEQDGKLKFSWDIAEGYWGSAEIRGMFDAYCSVLNALSAENSRWEFETIESQLKGIKLPIVKKVSAISRKTEALSGGLKLEASAADRFKPFPLTDQQQAYAFGRYMARRNNSCQIYQEIEAGALDVKRLEKSWHKLVKSHEMLFTVIRPDGTQNILEEVPDYQIRVADLTGKKAEEVQAELSKTRQFMAENAFDLDQWPYFDLRVSVLENRSLIHFSIDMIIADASSIHLLLKQLIYFYQNPGEDPKKPGVSFRDYVLSLQKYRKTESYQRSIRYWENKFAGIPPGPQLPVKDKGDVSTSLKHQQFKGVLWKWEALRETAARLSVQPGMILLTAYAEVFAAWLNHRPFSIVIPCWERLLLHPEINEVVGDFTSMSWVVVRGEKEPFEDKVRFYHAAVQEDLSHMPVSGLKALRKAAMAGSHAGMLTFPVVFSNMAAHSGVNIPKGFKKLEILSGTPQVLVDSISEERDGRLYFYWDVLGGVYPDGMIEEMFSGYKRVLEALASDPGNWKNINFDRLINAQPEKYRNSVDIVGRVV